MTTKTTRSAASVEVPTGFLQTAISHRAPQQTQIVRLSQNRNANLYKCAVAFTAMAPAILSMGE